MSTPTPPPGGKVYGPFAPTPTRAPSRPGSPRPDDPSYVGPAAPPAQPFDLEKLLHDTPATPPPLSLGVSPGTLNLSLPTNGELQKAATPDPWRGRDRFAAGQPTEITTLGEAFAKAGGDLEEAHSLSMQTQKMLAQGYTNDTTPVYDQATHIASLPKNFPNAPARLTAVGTQLGHTATELTTRTLDAENTVNALLDDLHTKRLNWETEWKAARNPDGLIPFDHVDALLARRTTVAAQMQAVTNTAGATIGASVTAYQGILADGMKVLSTIGYVPPDNLDAGPGDMDFNAETGTAAAAGVTDAVNAGADPGTLTRIDSANRGVALLNAKVAAGSPLTTGETQFLNAYYDRLATSGTFTRLEGAVQAAAPMAYPSSQSGDQAANSTLGTVANGLMNLSQVDDGKQVPASVTGLLNQPVGVAADPNNNGQSRGTDGRLVVAGLQQYEGTAGVLGRATVDGNRSPARSGSPRYGSSRSSRPRHPLSTVCR